MKQIIPSNLVVGQSYQISYSGKILNGKFLGIRMEGSTGFRDVKFQSALNGDRWVFHTEHGELEFKKGWDHKMKSGLVPADENKVGTLVAFRH